MNPLEKSLSDQALMYFVVRACQDVGKRMAHLRELQSFAGNEGTKKAYAEMIDEELEAFDLACQLAYPNNDALHNYMAELVDYHSGDEHKKRLQERGRKK